MGRPLKKSLLGETGTNDKIQVQMWGGSSVVSGWIVEQVATGEFIVSDGSVTDRVELQAETVTAAGQARIVVTVFGGGTEYAKNVLAHRVKTFEGGNYIWSLTAAAAAGHADVALA